MNPFRKKEEQTEDPPPPLSPTNYHSFLDSVLDAPNDSGDDEIQPVRSETTQTTNRPEMTSDYRGFSTSISDMFASPEHERIDCCALTCCGMLQSDRDRYLLQGVTPPGMCRRFVIHVTLPFTLFLLAGFAAIHIAHPLINQLVATGIVVLLIVYFANQCFKGSAKRIDVRKDLLWTKYQVQNNRRQNLAVLLEQVRPDDDGQDYYLGQTRRDFRCGHPFCVIGCYADDRPNTAREDQAPDNFCSSLYKLCCGPTCGMHLQICGACALAQEARELETYLLPASYRRIDYLTMQAYSDYYPNIYRAKWPENENTGSWKKPALSRLSYRLLQSLLVLFSLMLFWSFFNSRWWRGIVKKNIPQQNFHFGDFLVFVAAWVQVIVLLVILAWACNRPKKSELSADAMIKFFASGFCLSTTLAVFWELVCGLVVKVFVTLILAIFGVDAVEDPDVYNSIWVGFGVTNLSGPLRRSAASDEPSFLETFGRDHPIFYTIYIAINAFLLAALIEELSKYFGYRMVEHPDFLSKQEMDEAMTVDVAPTDEDEEEGSNQRQERINYSNQRQSFQAQGAAITLAMICVAMGFTCCENLVYIFIYGGDTISSELSVLIARAFFPVHPIAAAIQSIGVVERDVEASRATKIGRIILPAVLFHGGYDFFILWIDFMARRHGVYANDNDDDDAFDAGSILAVWLSLLASALAMGAALVYYFRKARKQRRRLEAMDRQVSVDRSRLI